MRQKYAYHKRTFCDHRSTSDHDKCATPTGHTLNIYISVLEKICFSEFNNKLKKLRKCDEIIKAMNC